MSRDSLVTPIRAATAAGIAVALSAAVPALASAPSDGSVLPTVPVATAKPVVKPAAPARTKIVVRTERNAGSVGARALYRGRVKHAPRGTKIRLEILRGGRWRTAERVGLGRHGSFRIAVPINRIGRTPTRLRVVKRTGVTGDRERVKGVHGFRRAIASYYGPGLYGGPLACGGRLSPGTLGVAHKSLPCGTSITVRVGSRQVRTKVVDRGPYVGNREFDLTAATRNRIGFGDVGTVLVDR